MNELNKQSMTEGAGEPAGRSAILPINILVAEDDFINRRVIERSLARLGYTCDIVENGRKAVESAGAKKYQLIFLDMMMPEMDGDEAAKLIAERHPGNEKPIIVALTAHNLLGGSDKRLTIGMDDYVTKPYDLKDIANIIEKWQKELLSKI